MRSILLTCIGILVSLSCAISTERSLKPKFHPYCVSKGTCISVCKCELSSHCLLLTMDETTRNSILFYHNQIRQMQSLSEPQPAGIAMLQYDMELEEISSCWVGRCSNEYSHCFLTPKFNETSQSVVQLILERGESPNTYLWMQVMSYGLKQAQSISPETFSTLPGGKKYEIIHNFAQLVSDQILSVGCAWSLLDNLLTFVCTYGPRGPKSGEAIYKVGYSCTQCPKIYECDHKKPFHKLCKRKAETNPATMIPASLLILTSTISDELLELIPVSSSSRLPSTTSLDGKNLFVNAKSAAPILSFALHHKLDSTQHTFSSEISSTEASRRFISTTRRKHTSPILKLTTHSEQIFKHSEAKVVSPQITSTYWTSEKPTISQYPRIFSSELPLLPFRKHDRQTKFYTVLVSDSPTKSNTLSTQYSPFRFLFSSPLPNLYSDSRKYFPQQNSTRSIARTTALPEQTHHVPRLITRLPSRYVSPPPIPPPPALPPPVLPEFESSTLNNGESTKVRQMQSTTRESVTNEDWDENGNNEDYTEEIKEKKEISSDEDNDSTTRSIVVLVVGSTMLLMGACMVTLVMYVLRMSTRS